MTADEVVVRVREIEALVRQQRYEVALALTERLESELEAAVNEPTITPPVRALVRSSRFLTEALITLRTLQVH